MSNGHGKVHLTIYALAVAGAALLIYLLVSHGLGDVARAVAAARWGVLAVAIYHLLPLFLDTLSWWNLFPVESRPALPALFRMRWVGESVSYLLPTSSVGGDILRARLAALRGVPIAQAAASVLADITLGICVQAFFTLLGLGLLILATGQAGIKISQVMGGVAVAAVAVGGFYTVQHIGLFKILGILVKRLAKDPAWHALAERGGGIDLAVRSVYGNRRSVFSCCFCTLLAWLASSGEVWLALHVVGVDAGFDKAIILESMTQGVRAVMFFIPGALGVQEGGYVIIGHMIGIPYDTALAISLIRRARELALGIPGLITWQFIEGHRFLRNRKVQTAE
jgi:putative membrane protein